MPTDTPRYRATELTDFAERLFLAAGCEANKATAMARHLVEADLMGHTTHGLAQVPGYLEEIEAGLMAKAGEPRLIADQGAAITWDGETLPGIWLTDKALALAAERARRHGLAAVAIRRSHHIGCLAVYLRWATERNLMAIVASSDPSEATMAPFGGVAAVFTPDPIAFGIPTGGDPILVDISSSITTNGMTGRLRREGRRYPGLWAQDAQGRPTDDPAVLAASPPGSLLPTGGTDHGHKGYGLALAVEALTQGLAGHGRAEKPTTWAANVYVQVMDPAGFGGADAFLRQTSWLAKLCRETPPAPGVDSVRLPGQQASSRRRAGLAEGLALYPGIMDGLAGWAAKLKVTMPEAMA
ncbi:MAG TPA: Ldh family oxidoreductase [Verrucomicrobiae bacterium]|nr:Ldh family oxidoreductase [Verrucomicrobiae bacterium]